MNCPNKTLDRPARSCQAHPLLKVLFPAEKTLPGALRLLSELNAPQTELARGDGLGYLSEQ
jgi:hypothetical protein